MKNVFQLEAILAAAFIGAIAVVVYNHAGEQGPFTDAEAIGVGAFAGAFVQVGVRLIGIS